jgi:hypothetical protein
MSVERPPSAGQVNYKHWAERLNDYLVRTRSHLAHYISGSTAYREGMLVWDDVNKTILYSGNGQWNTIGNGVAGADGTDGTNGTGFTGGSYNSSTGIITFTSNDGLGFSTTDVRGADGIANYPDVTALYYNGNVKAQATADGVTVTGDVEATEFIGDLRGAVVFKAKAGEALTKGDVVCISGISGNTTVVSKADADDSTKMQGFGLAAIDANNNANLEVYTFGTLHGLDTSSYALGAELYVSTTAGQLTDTPPTGESSALQKIAKVTRVHATSGSLKIMGAGRINSTPNLNSGNIFIGDSNNQAVTASLATQVSTLETSHDDVLQDGDFASEGLMKRDATSGSYSIVTDNSGNWNTAHGWGNHADASYLTSYTETNNLSTAVIWADVPNVNITEGSVTQHQSAINAGVSITESQISNLQSYLTAETSHADVLVDGDFTSNGLMKRDGAGVYSVDSSTYATETYVDTAVSNLVDSAPATLDTLNELASALGDDANFSTTVTNSLSGKANLSGASFTGNVSSTGTISANNFSSTIGFSSQYGNYSSQTGNITTGGTISAGSGTVSGGTISGSTFACSGSMGLAGNISVGGTVDGRDVATDGTKLDTIEIDADVTDTVNVTAAGALMDSEVTNLAQVKAFDSSDYATAAQGSSADTAYSWGDHDAVGYLTTFDITTQTDPKYLRADASDTTTGTITAAGLSTSGNVVSSGTCQANTLVATGNINATGDMTVLGNYNSLNGSLNLSGGSITLGGTVDGVDIAARDAVLTSTTTTANSALQNLVDDTTPQLGGNLDLNGWNITGGSTSQIEARYISAGLVGITSQGGIYATSSIIYGNTLQSAGDTTVGGDLSVSSGNITVGGYIKTDFIEGSQYSLSNIDFYDTATQGGNGTTLSSTAGLSFKYDTNANDDDGFKVFANGNSTACFTIDNNENITVTGNTTVGGNVVVTGTVDGVDITARDAVLTSTTTTANSAYGWGNHANANYLTTHQDITGKANLSGATFTGGVSIGTLPSNPENLSVTGVTNLYSGANVTGNIAVTGTVDGRDVATDGARLDTIPYHRVNEVGLRTFNSGPLSLTTTLQNVGKITDIIHPSTPVDCSRYVDLKLYLEWRYVSSNTNDLELQAQIVVPANPTVVNMGTITILLSSSTYITSSYEAWGYVSGDYTHHFTEFGKANKTGTANGTPMRVRAWQYDESLDRTYFLHDSNPGISFVTGDTAYWHPYDWESAGTLFTKTIEIDERYVTYAHQNESLKFKVAYDDSRLTYRFKIREVSTTDSALLDLASVTFTDVGKV